MLTQDYLTLRLVRLKNSEEWLNQAEGFSFLFVKGGIGKYVSRQVSRNLVASDVLVLPALSGGAFRSANNGEVAFSMFSLKVEHLFPLFEANEICVLQDVMDAFKQAKFYPASTPLARDCQQLLSVVPPQFNLDHRGHLLRIAAAILSAEFNTARPQRVGFVRADEHLIQVFEKLSSAELLTMSVHALAEKFGCSRRHLNRLFHKHFGTSVAALRMELRLLKAVSLLRDPSAKVIRIAEECGFNHLGLFNTVFKRRFGTSPGEWRKQNIRRTPAAGNSRGDQPPASQSLLHMAWNGKAGLHSGIEGCPEPKQAPVLSTNKVEGPWSSHQFSARTKSPSQSQT